MAAPAHRDGLQGAPAHGPVVTPDGRLAYVAAEGDNQAFDIDARTLKEVARIPVGQVPERIATAVLQVY